MYKNACFCIINLAVLVLKKCNLFFIMVKFMAQYNVFLCKTFYMYILNS